MATQAEPKSEVIVGSEVPDRSLADTGADESAHLSDIRIMKDSLAKQGKVRVKLAEDTPVTLDGYRLLIQGGVRVEVPQQVADVLEEAGRI